MQRAVFATIILFALFFPPPQSADEGARWTAEWERVYSVVMPPAGINMCMVFDEARSRAVLYGGRRPGTGDLVWEWDGRRWSSHEPGEGGPGDCISGEMVYDHGLGSVVVHRFDADETDEAVSLHRSWTWNGEGWIEVRSSDESVWPRRYFVSAYDQTHDATIIYGGNVRGSVSGAQEALAEDCYLSGFFPLLNDTWVLEQEEGDWEQFDGDCLVPGGARLAPALFYDEIRQAVLLSGGIEYDGPFHEMWKWNGEVWQLLSAEYRPEQVAGFSLAYDSARKSAVLFGGYDMDAEGNFLDKEESQRPGLWEWNGDRWRGLESVGIEPQWRGEAAMVYDSARDEIILFGGDILPDGETSDEMWRLSMRESSRTRTGCACD